MRNKKLQYAAEIAGLALIMGVVAFADPITDTLIDSQPAGVMMSDGCEYFSPTVVRCSEGQAPEFIEPCPTEDSLACVWDASSRGNGLGRSFVVGWDDVPRMLGE